MIREAITTESMNTTDVPRLVESAYELYRGAIEQTLATLSGTELEADADFLWFVFFPQELRGLPVRVFPTDRHQESDDLWEHSYSLKESVPESVVLPDELAGTPAMLDLLRDAVANYLSKLWQQTPGVRSVPAYFSIDEDPYYFRMRDGVKIQVRDLEAEFE